MDSLLCDEDWLKSPTHSLHKFEEDICMDSLYTSREEYTDYFTICLQKQHLYMPKHGYVHRLNSSQLLRDARTKAIRFFIKSCSRLNLASQTIFDAVNYYDRFVSTNQYNAGDDDDDDRMRLVQSLSMACLSISAKFGEVSIPQLHQFQINSTNDLFQSRTIKLMELEILKALQWRLNCVTPYTFKELLIKFLDYDLQPQMHLALASRVTELLLGAISDPRFIEFRPCTVAISALRCSLEELLPSKSDAYLLNLASLVPQDQKVDINNCHKIMEERVADPIHGLAAAYGYPYFPSSPVTVLPIQQIGTFDCYIDLSMVSDTKKRKREGTAPTLNKRRLFDFN